MSLKNDSTEKKIVDREKYQNPESEKKSDIFLKLLLRIFFFQKFKKLLTEKSIKIWNQNFLKEKYSIFLFIYFVLTFVRSLMFFEYYRTITRMGNAL